MTDQEHIKHHQEIGNESVRTALKFENGQKEISGMRADIIKLQTTIEPKPVNWPYVIFSSIGVLVVLLTAWFALGSKFAERPTRLEVDRQIQTLVTSQADLSKAQVEQRRVVDKIEANQDASDKVLVEMHEDIRSLIRARR